MKFYNFLFINIFITLVYSKLEWNSYEIASPRVNPKFCNVEGIKSPVICDPENKIPLSYKKQWNYYLLRTMSKTMCVCKPCNNKENHVVTGLVIISAEKINGNCSSIECYMDEILKNWNLGNKCKNNGILLLAKENYVYAHAQRKVRKYYPPSCTKRILRISHSYTILRYKIGRVLRMYTLSLRDPCQCKRICNVGVWKLRWFTKMSYFMAFLLFFSCIGCSIKRARQRRLNNIYHDRSHSNMDHNYTNWLQIFSNSSRNGPPVNYNHRDEGLPPPSYPAYESQINKVPRPVLLPENNIHPSTSSANQVTLGTPPPNYDAPPPSYEETINATGPRN